VVLGLERVNTVAEDMELLPAAPRIVLVGGTNGKGSVATLTAEILRACELRVGTYLSPHLWNYTERVQVAGADVAEAWLCEAFDAVELARDGVPLTYFEFGTLAALWVFREAALDVAVVEVGLGGRLDATNIVDPDVSVITNIGLDHQQLLGTTRDAIAREKAGILRLGGPAVIGERDPPPALSDAAQGADARWLGRDFDLTTEGSGWRYTDDTEWSLPGPLAPHAYLRDNAACAIAAARTLVPGLGLQHVMDALAATALPGRCQRLPGRPELLLDVGHNPEAARALAGALADSGLPHPRVAVFGMLDDKDAAGYVEALAGQVDAWIVTEMPTPRASSAIALISVLQTRGQQVIARAPSPWDGLVAARDAAGPTGSVLVLGSFHCAGAIPPAGIYSGA
jgi:dihydrofolate synthase / folylpolyglutamate synthase